jgi:hypothetical protein
MSDSYDAVFGCASLLRPQFAARIVSASSPDGPAFVAAKPTVTMGGSGMSKRDPSAVLVSRAA